MMKNLRWLVPMGLVCIAGPVATAQARLDVWNQVEKTWNQREGAARREIGYGPKGEGAENQWEMLAELAPEAVGAPVLDAGTKVCKGLAVKRSEGIGEAARSPGHPLARCLLDTSLGVREAAVGLLCRRYLREALLTAMDELAEPGGLGGSLP